MLMNTYHKWLVLKLLSKLVTIKKPKGGVLKTLSTSIKSVSVPSNPVKPL